MTPAGLSGLSLTVKVSGCSFVLSPGPESLLVASLDAPGEHGGDRRVGPFSVTERKKGTTWFHPWKRAGNAGLARLQSGSVGELRGAGLGSSSPSPPAAREAAPLPHPSLRAARLSLNRVDGAERGAGREHICSLKKLQM